MHELGMARDLFQEILKQAAVKKLTKIDKITLSIGVASGIEKDFLTHSFRDHIFPGTIAEAAELIYQDEPVKTVCMSCQKEIQESSDFSLNCPFCQSYNIEITQGKDIRIISIEGKG
jgi:hydrogenase nickel incorporation protein HypA/HybF